MKRIFSFLFIILAATTAYAQNQNITGSGVKWYTIREAEKLNTKFYPVKFNAEGKEAVTFMGQLSYPTVVFLTLENDKLGVSPVPGYRPPKEMEPLLSFFADKAYKTTSWEEYQKSFVGKVR